MEFVNDLFFLIVSCVKMLNRVAAAFWITLAVGLVLGGVCWGVCSYYSQLWNLRYRITATHHVLCAFAAVLTVVFTLTFVSLKYTQEVARAVINAWQDLVQLDRGWQSGTFRTAYEEVKALGVEDFGRYPHPDEGGHLIPLSKQESGKTYAGVYAAEAVEHFKKSHPYLSKILWAESMVPAQVINDDVAGFFAAHQGGTYPATDAVKLAADHIRRGLDIQVPRVVPISRAVIVILFLFVQAVPFGLIGFAAYRDLKVTT